MNYLTLLVLAYLAALLWFGIRGGTRERELNAFLTAGGSAGALLCAFSLVSTIIGGSATLGMGALAQKVGPAAFWWLGVGAIGLFLHGLIIAPVVRKLPVVTLPDVLRHLAGPAAEKWAGAIIALSWAAVTAAQFTALRALLHSISGGMTAEVLYVLLAAGIVLHTALGGQRGILRADFLHTILLLGGFSAAALWCVMERSADIAALPVMPFTETFGLGDWVKMMLLVGITYLIGPDMFSRTFAAKNAQTARRAAWTAAPLLVFFGVIVTMLALLNIKAEQPISDWLAVGSPLPAAAAAALSMGLISALAGSADTSLGCSRRHFGRTGRLYLGRHHRLAPQRLRALRPGRCRAAPRPRRRPRPTRGSQALDYWSRRGRSGRACRQPYRHHPLDLRRHRCCRPFCGLCRTARRPNPPNGRRVTASAPLINLKP